MFMEMQVLDMPFAVMRLMSKINDVCTRCCIPIYVLRVTSSNCVDVVCFVPPVRLM